MNHDGITWKISANIILRLKYWVRLFEENHKSYTFSDNIQRVRKKHTHTHTHIYIYIYIYIYICKTSWKKILLINNCSGLSAKIWWSVCISRFQNYYYYYYYYYQLYVSFSHQFWLVIFHLSLRGSKSPQISTTLLSVLADFKTAVVWTVSILPQTSPVPPVSFLFFHFFFLFGRGLLLFQGLQLWLVLLTHSCSTAFSAL